MNGHRLPLAGNSVGMRAGLPFIGLKAEPALPSTRTLNGEVFDLTDAFTI